MEQLNIQVNNEKDQLLDQIRIGIEKEIDDVELTKFLFVEKLGDEKFTGISIRANNSVAIRLQFRKKSCSYIEFRVANSKFFADYHILENNDEWNKIELENDADILSMLIPISETFIKVLLMYENESFGCCSRYVECSDAKKCIHPSRIKAQGCRYKIQLEKGNIFYGKNKTI